MNPYSHCVTLENAQKIIIDGSNTQPVLVYFFTSQANSLSSILEKMVMEAAGKVVLAKVNCDEQQELAGHFGVQSLPTVALFIKGQPVDGFAGEQPESVLREFLQKHLPSAEDEALQQALLLMEQQDYKSAAPLLTQALTTAIESSDIKLALIDCYLNIGSIEQAKQLLDTIPLQDRDSKYTSLLAQFELASQASSSPEIEALEKQLKSNPDDKNLVMQLAIQYSQNEQKEQALELIFNKILIKDLNYQDGEAKHSFVSIIATLADGNPLAAKFRRKLYTLLY